MHGFLVDFLDTMKKDFRNFEYSFFNIPPLQVVLLPTTKVSYHETDPLDYEKANSRATRMIFQKNAEEALPLINKTIACYPNGIQSYINKGMALLQLPDPDVNELKNLYSKFSELKDDKRSYLHAKVHYTFWAWETVPLTFESHVQALMSFESILRESDEDSSVERVKLQSCLYCAKTIYRLLRSFSDEEENESWMTENNLVQKGFRMLKTMRECNQPYYKLFSWVWLSEFQQLYFDSDSPLTEIINDCLSQLRTEAGYENCSILMCASKALQIFNSVETETLDPQFDLNDFYGRLGKSYYYLAINNFSIEERHDLLEKAIDLAGKYVEMNIYQAYFVPELCVKILLHLWAVKYYRRYKDRVETFIQRDCSGRSKVFLGVRSVL